MTYPFPFGGISVTRERPIYDRFNDVSSWDRIVINNCVEFPSSSSEAGVNNTGVTDVRTLLVPSGSDITALDRIVLHAAGSATPPPEGSPLRTASTYQVNGRPKDWTHAMTGWRPGMTVELERVS